MADEPTALATPPPEVVHPADTSKPAPQTASSPDPVIRADAPPPSLSQKDQEDKFLKDLEATTTEHHSAKAEGREPVVPEKKKADEAAAPNPEDAKEPTPEELEAAVKRSNLRPAEKANWKAMREGLEKAKSEAAQAQKEAQELRDKYAKAGPVPEEVTKELLAAKEQNAALAAKLREFDIRSDPAFAGKYVRPIEEGKKQIAELLTRIGKAGGAEDEVIKKTIAAYEAKGFSLGALAVEITALEKAGDYENAETLRDHIRTIRQLEQAQKSEIDNWQSGYHARTAAQQEAMKQSESIAQKAYQDALTGNMTELTKHFSFLAEPPKPVAGDTPAVAKAKQSAWDEWNGANAAIEVTMKGEQDALASGDVSKQAEARGRIFALARLGAFLSKVIGPNAAKMSASTLAKLKDAEGELAKLRKTGDLSKQHISDMGADKTAFKSSGDAGKDLDAQFAKLGIDIRT